jgi:hypothetical protein
MNKIVIALALSCVALSASAVEVGVTAGRSYAGTDRDSAGITVGQRFGAYGVTAGFDRATSGTNDRDTYSVVGSYDVVKFGPATVAAKAGALYMNNQTTADGYALVYGAGVSVPVAKQVSVGLDVTRQLGQSRVSAQDGNKVAVNVKYGF